MKENGWKLIEIWYILPTSPSVYKNTKCVTSMKCQALIYWGLYSRQKYKIFEIEIKENEWKWMKIWLMQIIQNQATKNEWYESGGKQNIVRSWGLPGWLLEVVNMAGLIRVEAKAKAPNPWAVNWIKTMWHIMWPMDFANFLKHQLEFQCFTCIIPPLLLYHVWQWLALTQISLNSQPCLNSLLLISILLIVNS